MSLQPHCLDNIIGLSQTDCDCFTEGMPVNALTSNSGIYLDQLEGLNISMADSLKDCDNDSLWNLMDRARSNATLTFKADLMGMLTTKYKPKRQPFSGTIGSTKFTRNLDLTSGYYGIRVHCANIISGIMSLKRIGLVFDTAGTFNIFVYNNYEESPIAQYSVTANANQLTWYNLALPLNLDMNNYASENPEYFIVYQKAGFKPKDNQICCGCGGGNCRWYFDKNNPKYSKQEKDRWTEYVMIGGVNLSDTSVTTRDNSGTVNYMYGLILDVDFKCKVQDLICKDSLDFENNGIALAMAYAVRYKAGVYLSDMILASGNINRYTMTDRERIMGKKNSYETQYMARMQWLTDNINYQANDCLACQDFDDVIKAGIFA